MEITRPGFPTNAKVEASSFSVWNCVITFLQILMVSTMLFGAECNTGQLDNNAHENLTHYHQFRAFYFWVWTLQCVALSLLLVCAVGKQSYHLCHSWVLCEALMQLFVFLSAVYLAYRAFLEDKYNQRLGSYSLPPSNVEFSSSSSTTSSTSNSHYCSFRLPRHFAFLIILHFLIKGFGVWVVLRYMILLRTTNMNIISNTSEAGEKKMEIKGTTTFNHEIRQETPPPSYACVCTDDLS